MVWVALTNGSERRIYNALAPVPADEKLFKSVRIEDVEASEILRLLDMPSLREAKLDELWRSAIAERQVREAVTLLLTDLVNSGPFAEQVLSLRFDLRHPRSEGGQDFLDGLIPVDAESGKGTCSRTLSSDVTSVLSARAAGSAAAAVSCRWWGWLGVEAVGEGLAEVVGFHVGGVDAEVISEGGEVEAGGGF